MKIDDINKVLAIKFNRDVRVISLITRHPFRFTRDVMSDPEDHRPVHLMYFGKFAQKTKYNKALHYLKTKLMELMKL